MIALVQSLCLVQTTYRRYHSFMLNVYLSNSTQHKPQFPSLYNFYVQIETWQRKGLQGLKSNSNLLPCLSSLLENSASLAKVAHYPPKI